MKASHYFKVNYWDTYWTIQGLLASGMHPSAFAMLLNFAHPVHKYVTIPTAQGRSAVMDTCIPCLLLVMLWRGNRVYYISNSEPPMFALTVDDLVQHPSVPSRSRRPDQDRPAGPGTGVPVLDDWAVCWRDRTGISQPRWTGANLLLNRYTGGLLGTPRPESYYEDYAKELMNITNQPHQSDLLILAHCCLWGNVKKLVITNGCCRCGSSVSDKSGAFQTLVKMERNSNLFVLDYAAPKAFVSIGQKQWYNKQ